MWPACAEAALLYFSSSYSPPPQIILMAQENDPRQQEACLISQDLGSQLVHHHFYRIPLVQAGYKAIEMHVGN